MRKRYGQVISVYKTPDDDDMALIYDFINEKSTRGTYTCETPLKLGNAVQYVKASDAVGRIYFACNVISFTKLPKSYVPVMEEYAEPFIPKEF